MFKQQNTHQCFTCKNYWTDSIRVYTHEPICPECVKLPEDIFEAMFKKAKKE